MPIVFRSYAGTYQTGSSNFFYGMPAPVTINSVVASATPYTYPYTASDVKGTSITNGINYNVYSFTSVSATTSYTVNYSCSSATTIYVLAVGGGGAGGGGTGGGGGAGGVVMMPISLLAGTSTININIGSGGASAANFVVGNNGNNTTVNFTANPSANIIAWGGGGGGSSSGNKVGNSGGSGGGAPGTADSGGIYAPGNPNNNYNNYGNIGGTGSSVATTWNPGGGGGAGVVGTSGNGAIVNPGTAQAPGMGGNGIQCFLPGICNFAPSGTTYGTYYWGGGGGGSVMHNNNLLSAGNGGLGGGGGGNIESTSTYLTVTYGGGLSLNSGGNGNMTTGGNGGANTGGGGGAEFGNPTSQTSGSGGSGIVIIAFPSATAVSSNQSAVLPASIVSSGLYSATLNNATLSSSAYNSIKGAYACRLLNYNYFGPIMTLRHSLDTTGSYTQNFYSDICGNLGTGYMGTGQSVSTWLSGNAANTTYAFVTKWYNQGMDVSFNCATQYTTTSQPIYDVSNGLLNFGYTGAGGGVSAPQTNCYLNLPNGALPYSDASYTISFRHWNIPTTGNFGFINGGLNNANANCLCIRTNSNAYFEYWGNYNFSVSSSIVPNNVISSTYVSSSSQQPFYVNSSLITTGTMASPRTQVNTSNFIGVTNTSTTSPGSEYINGQIYNMYIFNSSLGTTDRQIVEATPYQYSFPPVIAGLSASQVTSTTFVLGWSTVSSAQTYALWINGSYFATYNAPALTTGTVTPTTSGPWTLNLYAYNASNVLLATGSTGAVLLAGASLSANTGATQTTNGTNTVFTFTSSGTFTVASTGYASVLIVGGGGGGGSNYGGGGGAGGLVYYDANYKPMLLTAGTSYTVTVGTGGVGSAGTGGRGGNGLDSTFNGYIAKGGGGGSYNNGGNAAVTGVDGGSGGGSNNIATPGVSTQPSYANAFYVGGYSGGQGSSVNMVTGGGGGAGGVGGAPTSSATVSGVGGPGYSCNIIGTPTYYGGGGGGGAFQQTGGSGGVGGGGNGGYQTSAGTGFAGSVGIANTGGGGGGSSNAGTGYNGGSGVVIISCQGLTAIAGLATSSVTATNFVLSWTTVATYSYILWINGINYGAVTTGSTITPGTTGPWTLGLYGYNASNVLTYYGTTNSLLIASITNNGFPATLFPFWSNTTNYATNANDGSTFGTACVYTSATGYKSGVGSLSQPTVTGGFLTNPITYTSGAAISFGGWFNLTNSSIFCHISMNGGSNRYFLNNSTGINLGWNGVGVGGAQGASSSAFTSYTNGTWIHIIVVIPSSGNTVAYVNGSLVATPLTSTTISPGATFTNVNTVLFGYNGPGAASTGNINNFYIFNRTLSATEVTALYNQ